MELNITQKLQEFFQGLNLNKMYNLSFAFSVLSCPDIDSNKNILINDHSSHETSEAQDEDGILTDALNTVLRLFDFVIDDNRTSGHEDRHYTDCFTIITLSLNELFSPYLLVLLSFMLFFFFTFNILQVLQFLFKILFSKKYKNKINDQKHDISQNNMLEEDSVESEMMNFDIPSGSESNEKIENSPVQLKNFSRYQNLKEMNTIEMKNCFDVIFDTTFSKFLKEVDNLLGFEVQQLLRGSLVHGNSPLLAVSPASIDLGVQSPRVRRKWNRPQDIEPCHPLKIQLDINGLKNWIMFESFCRKMCWSTPRSILDNFHSEIKDEQTAAIQFCWKFIQHNCPTSMLEWSISVLFVNYTLFLLKEILEVTKKSNDIIYLETFESTGSVANGTFVGKPDHFDVRFVFNLNKSSDLVLLHNSYCEEISPGHVVIGVKDISNKDSLHSKDCFHRGLVKDTFGNFLVCNQIEKVVDGMIRRAIKKLTTEYQYRMEKLPFRLKTNFNDDLSISIDTRILNGIGFKLSCINVKFIPSLSVKVPEISLLPKLYVVPSWRMDHRRRWEGKNKKVGALTKLFLKGSSPRIPSNLFWNLSVSNLERNITENMQDRFMMSLTQSCCKDCLLILKTLFSSSSKQGFLSRGEIDSYILNTVVNFLVMESSASAWSMSELPNRVSDAVHFLRSSYKNVLLPNFVIHNPHLFQKVPMLDQLSPFLSGRQQNLLADIDTETANKTLDFIDSRLKETGFNKFMKAEFSDELWEYEFFLFG